MAKPSGSTVTEVPTIRKSCLYTPNCVWSSRRTSSMGSARLNTNAIVLANISQETCAVREPLFALTGRLRGESFTVSSSGRSGRRGTDRSPAGSQAPPLHAGALEQALLVDEFPLNGRHIDPAPPSPERRGKLHRHDRVCKTDCPRGGDVLRSPVGGMITLTKGALPALPCPARLAE
jgi:hypothetical protein